MSVGVKESKEVLVAVVGHVAPLLIKHLKDGAQVGDVMAVIDAWKNDEAFKKALEDAMDNIKAVPEEIKDLSASEGVELGVAALLQVPRILEALK